MYFLSIKRYNLEYTKSEKPREWDQSSYNCNHFCVGEVLQEPSVMHD